MAYDMTAALLVANEDQYAQYRAEIAPLLEKAGGAFRYDFRIAATLKSEVDHEINRLFILRFPDRAAKERFFADPQYRAIRARLFEPAAPRMTVVGEGEA